MANNRLKLLREEKGLSQREIAKKLNIPPTTYGGYENNKREPNSEMLITLADFFNCSIDYLLGRSDTPINDAFLDRVDEIDDDLLKQFGNLSRHLDFAKTAILREYNVISPFLCRLGYNILTPKNGFLTPENTKKAPVLTRILTRKNGDSP